MKQEISLLQPEAIFRLICVSLLASIVGCQPSEASQPTPTARATASPTPPLPTPSVSISSNSITDIDALFTRLNAEGAFSGAILIGQQGEILLSQGYGCADRATNLANTPATRFRLGSVTKQFTSMAILLLQAQDELSVQDPICDYIQDCPQAWGAITIEHLLTHTSGIPEFTSLRHYKSLQATPSTPNETIAHFWDLALLFSPGETARYSNSGYIVLGSIIEHVAGQSYEAFLQQAIFEPLAMHDTGYDHNLSDLATGYENGWTEQPAAYIDMSIPYAAGALYSTVEDLYRWDQALYTDSLLPPTALAEMFVPRVVINEQTDQAYGYGWVIGEKFGRTAHTHGGGINGFTASIARYPTERITIIMLANQEDVNAGLLQQIIAREIYSHRIGQ